MKDRIWDDAPHVESLWREYAETRGEQQRNCLVVHYGPLVKYVAGRFASTLPPHVDVDDLISDGTVGLVTAVERYDPARSIDFATFAIRRIRGAMIDGLRALDWLPRAVRAQVKELETCTQLLYAELGRTPTTAEVAHALGVAPAEVGTRRRHRDQAQHVPLRTGETHHGAVTEQRSAGRPEDTVPRSLVRELWRLPEREQVLMALYYYERLTMAEIGLVLGVSESRVSQLHQRIRVELRDRLTAGCQAKS